MKPDHRLLDGMAGEQFAAVPGVFGHNNIHLPQCAQRAQSDIFHVANRRADDEKCSGDSFHIFSLCGFGFFRQVRFGTSHVLN